MIASQVIVDFSEPFHTMTSDEAQLKLVHQIVRDLAIPTLPFVLGVSTSLLKAYTLGVAPHLFPFFSLFQFFKVFFPPVCLPLLLLLLFFNIHNQ